MPDLVIGTSVGSLNGAVIAFNPEGAANRLSHAWARITRNQIFPGGLLRAARTLERSKAHLFPNTGLAAVIADFLGAATTFDALSLPFAAVTVPTQDGPDAGWSETDIHHGELAVDPAIAQMGFSFAGRTMMATVPAGDARST
jgi:predicted acylesterase/phospholipase RssA